MVNANFHRAASLRATADQLLRLAGELERDEYEKSGLPPQRAHRSGHDDGCVISRQESLHAKVMEAYKARRRRSKLLPAELFGEPGWDLLLDLFAAHLQNRQISVTSACVGADVPNTTALRWIRVLERLNLVERVNSQTDLRFTWLHLTDYGASLMTDLFESMLDSSSEKTTKSSVNC